MMKEFIRAAQALSDETRVRIICLLLQRECCVCEVMQAMDISQTRASRNLKILNDAGFLDMRPEGLFTLYSIKTRFTRPFYGYLLDAAKSIAAGTAVTSRDAKKLKNAKRVGVKACCSK